MSFYKRLSGRNRSTKVRFCSDEYYTNLAAAIVHSGVTSGDVDFLVSEWCDRLLDFLGISLSGIDLLSKYQERQERRRVDDGER